MWRNATVCAGLLAVAASVSAAEANAIEVTVTAQDSGVTGRLRGISAVSSQVGWASGREGTVLLTTDGGQHWRNVAVAEANTLDFRDVEGFDAKTAVVLSIGPGQDSRVYRTEDGGRSWTKVLQNTDERAFFDCMVFDGKRGWLLGDPVDGHFQIYETADQGRSWTLRPDGPRAIEGEAAFAASGTCIARSSNALWVGSGGARSQLSVRYDNGRKWIGLGSTMGRDKPEAGVFSIAGKARTMIAVGGDFSAETSPGNAALVVTPSSRVPRVLPLPAPPGYRSGVAVLANSRQQVAVAVGPTGVDAWSGAAWQGVSTTGYDAISLAGNAGWASGAEGRIARVEVGPR